MEALSEVLRDLKLTGAVFLDAEFGEPWCIIARGRFARLLMPEAEHFIHYHLVVDGRCRVRAEGAGIELSVAAGDVLIVPHGDELVMGSNLRLAAFPLSDALKLPRRGELALARFGGSGEKTRFVCGFLACDPNLCRPILSALPRLFRVGVGSSPSGEWLRSSIRHSVTEAVSMRAGADVILARLSEALFVEVLRCYVESLPPEQTGWLAGLRDPHVGKGLMLLHGRHDHPWTVDELAHEVGCSRSVLAERFSHFLGQPPIQYLTRWRLALAASRLRRVHTPLARLAREAGYESEAAFSRAFKREFGDSPVRWRRKRQQASESGRAGNRSGLQ